MKGLLITRIIIEYAFFIANGRVTKRIIGYKIIDQLKDCLANYLLSFGVGLLIYFVFRNLNVKHIWDILIKGSSYLFVYIGLSALFKFRAFNVYKKIISEKNKKEIKYGKKNLCKTRRINIKKNTCSFNDYRKRN
jgi:hypothetical protein